MPAPVKVVKAAKAPAAQRRRHILRAVRAGRAAHVADLAHRLGVSQMTVRRDLTHLAREGKLTRVHGGAVVAEDEPPFGLIEVERPAAKDRIGRAAAALVEDSQTVMVDIGTTTLSLARHLHGRPVTVITSSLAVVRELLPDPAVDLVVLGGIVRRNYRSLVGVLAEDALRQVFADIAFLGTSGIRREDRSVLDSTMAEVPIKRGMLAAARRRILLADARKFSMCATVRVCALSDFDGIVTDASSAETGELGIEVIPA